MGGRLGILVALSSMLLLCTAVDAAVTRTFVSTSGSDANTSANCGPTMPCRSFGAALSMTASGGQVVVLNSGGYGAATISQSVTITAPAGVYAGVTAASGANAIVISGAGIDVTLQGLTINSVSSTQTGSGGIGIDILAAATVRIDRCSFHGMPVAAIYALADTSTQTTGLVLDVENSEFVQDGAGAEVWLVPNSATATVDATFRNVTMKGGDYYTTFGFDGIYVADGVTVSVADSQITGYFIGIAVTVGNGKARVTAANSVFSNEWNDVNSYVTQNSTGTAAVDLRNNVLTASTPTGTLPPGVGAVVACGAGTTVSLYANTIAQNSVGVNFAGGCTGTPVVLTFGNNQFVGNGADVSNGSLTSTASK